VSAVGSELANIHRTPEIAKTSGILEPQTSTAVETILILNPVAISWHAWTDY